MWSDTDHLKENSKSHGPKSSGGEIDILAESDGGLLQAPAHPLKEGNLRRSISRPSPTPFPYLERSDNRQGEFNLLCIRVQFQEDDTPLTTGNGLMEPEHNEYYYNAIFQQMSDYYKEVSYDQFNLNASVTEEIFTVDHNMSHYGSNGNEVQKNVYLINDTIAKADPSIDFSQYDFFIVIHAGSGEETDINNDSPHDIWSNNLGLYHFWAVLGGPIQTNDGKSISQISVIPETQNQDGLFSQNITGVACHEFGHNLGLPDLYDVEYHSDGIGIWGLMSAGPNLNGGLTPSHFCAWSKMYLNWVDPMIIDTNRTDVYIRNIEDYKDIYKIVLPGSNGKEYFLLENRQRRGFDRYLPGDGLLIWHIDENIIFQDVGWGFNRLEANDVNTWPNHKGVDLEEAGGTQELDIIGDYNSGDHRDPWFGKPEGFTPYTVPNTFTYTDINTEIHITDISWSSNNMSFSVNFKDRAIDLKKPNINTTSGLPGASISFPLRLWSNRARENSYNDRITLTVESDHSDLLVLSQNPAEIPLDADNIFVYANLTIPLDAHYQDLYIFHITAESQDDVQAPTGLTLTVSVEEILEFALSPIGNITLLPGEANVQNITIAFNNSGNDRERFDFSVELSDEDWEWELSQERVWLEPDSEHKIYLYLFSPDNSIFSDECVFDIFMEHSTGTLTTGFSAEVLQIFNLTMEVVDIADYATHSDPSVLNISVRNYGNGQDNISISLTGTKAGWTIDFSSDYLIIPRKGIRYFTVTITPQKLAHYNDDFPFTVKVHSQGGFSLESENLEVKVSKLVLLDLECDNKNITLSTKKNTVQVTVQLLNKGNVEDYYQMNVVMPPDVKMSLEGINKDNITIPAFNDIFMVMLFEFPDDITAGLYYIDIDISSSRQSDITLEMRLNITIPNIYELQVDFSSDKDGLDLSKSSSIKYTITVNNTSNRNITVILEDIGELKGFKITIQPKELTHKLDISEGGEFTILISSTPSSEIKNIDLSLKVRVLENGKTYSEDETLKVTRSIITNGDDDDDDSDSGEGKGGLMSSWIIWAVAGAILLFIICLVVVLVIKKGKKKDEELLLDDEIDDPGSSEEATETEEVEVAEVEIAPDTLEIKENDDTLHEDFASEENNMVKASDDEIIDQKENISGKEVSIPKPKPPKPPE